MSSNNNRCCLRNSIMGRFSRISGRVRSKGSRGERLNLSCLAAFLSAVGQNYLRVINSIAFVLLIGVVLKINSVAAFDESKSSPKMCEYGLRIKPHYEGVALKWLIKNYKIYSSITTKIVKVHNSNLIGVTSMEVMMLFESDKGRTKVLIANVNRCGKILGYRSE